MATATLSYPTAPTKSTGQGIAIVALCIGMALAAACIVVPQADANHRLVYERQKLQLDKQQITEQISVNAEFLKKVADDPQLAERLAQRQMKMLREGSSVLDLKEDWPRSTDMSPFVLVNVPPPAPLPPYQPMSGLLGKLCLNHQRQMDLLGISMFLVAAGLVLGGEAERVAR
jgi:hypothetical protein